MEVRSINSWIPHAVQRGFSAMCATTKEVFRAALSTIRPPTITDAVTTAITTSVVAGIIATSLTRMSQLEERGAVVKAAELLAGIAAAGAGTSAVRAVNAAAKVGATVTLVAETALIAKTAVVVTGTSVAGPVSILGTALLAGATAWAHRTNKEETAGMAAAENLAGIAVAGAGLTAVAAVGPGGIPPAAALVIATTAASAALVGVAAITAGAYQGIKKCLSAISLFR